MPALLLLLAGCASIPESVRELPAADAVLELEQTPFFPQQRFQCGPAALATVPVLVISLVLMQPNEPSQAEIEQARQELATAFAYIGRVSDRTFSRIEHEVGGELKDAVGGSVIKSIPKSEHQTQTQENQA